MKNVIICPGCDYEFSRDTETEEYRNIYGTRCNKCGYFIKPDDEPDFVKKNKEKINELSKEFIKKLK